MENYRFGQCLGWRFSPISTFFALVSSRAFRDAPHSRFRGGNPNQCLPNFLKMLILALPQIYTRVFYFWKFIDLDSAWVRDSRPYQNFFSLVSCRACRAAPHSRFRCNDPHQCLPNFSNMLLLALVQIYTHVFHLSKSVALDKAWDGDSRPFIFFLLRVFVLLKMRHIRDFGVVISNYAYWTF